MPAPEKKPPKPFEPVRYGVFLRLPSGRAVKVTRVYMDNVFLHYLTPDGELDEDWFTARKSWVLRHARPYTG
jgi:hypothetical protein